MSRLAGALALVALALATACANPPDWLGPLGSLGVEPEESPELEPMRVVDVGFAQPDPAPPPGIDGSARGRAVLVIPPAFEQFVYVHYDPRWRRTFRIHIGTYLRDRLAEMAARRFRSSRLAPHLHQVAPVPDDASLILVPELGQVQYQTPAFEESDVAVFQVRMRMRVLYSTRRDAALLYADGVAEGSFGPHGANTADLVRSAVDRMILELERTLAETATEL